MHVTISIFMEEADDAIVCRYLVLGMNTQLETAIKNFLEQKKPLSKSNNLSLKNLPFVTVGVCVKNSERTIRECLKSIVNSDYDKLKLEIVVVDGNSVDNTVTIAREILEKSGIGFKILSDKGKGLGYARQLAVDNAKGGYVCWVDGDNILPCRFLKSHVEFAEKHNNVGLFIPIILFREKHALARLEGYCWLLPTLNAVGKQKMPHLAMQGTLTPVKALKVSGGFNKSIKGAGEDIELIDRIRQEGYKVAVNPKAKIYHRTRGSWKTLYRQVSWWGCTQPSLSKRELFGQVLRRILLYTKLAPTVIKHFKDPIGFVMPFYMGIWNTWYLISSWG